MFLGNLDSLRDWGHAKDYVEGMWKILQFKRPEDFVLATGVSYSVRDFLNKALKRIGIKIKYQGEGVNEVGIVTENNDNANVSIGQEIIKIDPRYYRPTEVDSLTGDYSKQNFIKLETKYTLDEIIDEMF